MGLSKKKIQSEIGEVQFHCTAPATEPDPHESALFGPIVRAPMLVRAIKTLRCRLLSRTPRLRITIHTHTMCLSRSALPCAIARAACIGTARLLLSVAASFKHTQFFEVSVNYGRCELCAIRLIPSRNVCRFCRCRRCCCCSNRQTDKASHAIFDLRRVIARLAGNSSALLDAEDGMK